MRSPRPILLIPEAVTHMRPMIITRKPTNEKEAQDVDGYDEGQ